MLNTFCTYRDCRLPMLRACVAIRVAIGDFLAKPYICEIKLIRLSVDNTMKNESVESV